MNVGFAISAAQLLPEIEVLRGVADGSRAAPRATSVWASVHAATAARARWSPRSRPARRPTTPGCAAGDVVVAIDGREVVGDDDLIGSIRDLGPGASVDLTVVRNGTEIDLSVTLVRRIS